MLFSRLRQIASQKEKARTNADRYSGNKKNGKINYTPEMRSGEPSAAEPLSYYLLADVTE